MTKAKKVQKNGFPGEPIWEDWYKAQKNEKKREVGMARRIGRTAVDTVAGTVIAGKAIPIAVQEARLQYNQNRVKSLRRVVKTEQSAQAPEELVSGGRLRRLGSKVMRAADNSNAKSLDTRTERVKRLSDSKRAQEAAEFRPVHGWAERHFTKIDVKRRQKHAERQAEFRTIKDVAWEKYLAENPQVVEMANEAQAKHNHRQEQQARLGLKYTVLESARYQAKYLSNRNFSSFAKALPRYPERNQFSYDDLARSSLTAALTGRQEDGQVPLFKRKTISDSIDAQLLLSEQSTRQNADFYHTYNQLNAAQSEQTDYAGGVASLVWKLGFAEIEHDEDVPYGKGRFSPAVEWSQGENDTTYASIPFNPENELHQLIAGDRTDVFGSRLQLAITPERYERGQDPGLSLSLVPQMAEIAA